MQKVFLIRDSRGRKFGNDPLAVCTTEERAKELMKELFEEEQERSSGVVTHNDDFSEVDIEYNGEFTNVWYSIEEAYLNDWL